MDRLLDSVWGDTRMVQTRAAQERPLTSLRQRFELERSSATAGGSALLGTARASGLGQHGRARLLTLAPVLARCA
jgi:hypothetical protein